jgi:hypothetical protein
LVGNPLFSENAIPASCFSGTSNRGTPRPRRMKTWDSATVLENFIVTLLWMSGAVLVK